METKMIKQSLKRKGYKSEDIDHILHQIDSAKTESYQPTVSFPFEIEPNRIALFFLKIAYEYTCLKLDVENCWKTDLEGKECTECLNDFVWMTL